MLWEVPVQECVRALFDAREVLGETFSRMPDSGGPVRAVVYESWRRSRLQGLEPNRVAPAFVDLELDTYLTRAVAPLVEKRRAALDQAMCALILSDHEGRVLRRWVPDRSLVGKLDKLDIAPRFAFGESDVGTTSGITLLSGKPEMVRGPEHFADAFHALTCAGAPIVHPILRRVVGGLHLTCKLVDTSPVLLSWVMELALEVERALRESACHREQLLLDAYLAHNRDARHPLVALDERTVITNASAARLVSSVDQAMLWEYASRGMHGDARLPGLVTLTDGTRVSVETHPIANGPEVVGAVLKIKPAEERDGARSGAPMPASLPGLVGRSDRWFGFCESARRVAPDSGVLMVGEPGSGRLAAVAAVAPAGPLRVLDAAESAAVGTSSWLHAVEIQVDGPEETLVLRHIDRLNPEIAHLTAAALGRRPTSRVFATSERGPIASGPRNPLLERFSNVLQLPPLRERLEDLPVLLAHLSERFAGSGAVRWMPDAIQALSRLDWPGNLASLETLVRSLVSGRKLRVIGARDLPADIRASAVRRPLAGLEQAEAEAIVRALRDAGGNKHRAAESLGIARSTLYRKVRALGLDLSSAAF